MCDERERLIGFVYDECDGAEKRVIQSHVEECGTCRAEIAGLRRVRQDLLAWDVPEHETVWRPFAPARAAAGWWRDVPAWAMAAAAAAILAVGAAGGVAGHTMAERANLAHAATLPVATVTTDDLNAFETRMINLLRREVDGRLAATPMRTASFDLSDLEQRVLNQMRADLRRSEERQSRRYEDIDVALTAYGNDIARNATSLNEIRRSMNAANEYTGAPGGLK